MLDLAFQVRSAAIANPYKTNVGEEHSDSPQVVRLTELGSDEIIVFNCRLEQYMVIVVNLSTISSQVLVAGAASACVLLVVLSFASHGSRKPALAIFSRNSFALVIPLATIFVYAVILWAATILAA
jgi:hypothetical protein